MIRENAPVYMIYHLKSALFQNCLNLEKVGKMSIL